MSTAQPSSITPPTEQSSSTLKDLESEHIKQLLDRYDGNRKRVAEALGISERTIYRKLKKLELV